MGMHVRDAAARRRYGNRPWIALTAAVLFAGLFLQITMLSRISSVSKRASALESETARLNREAVNLELRVNEFHNLDRIAERAQQMGMVQPDEAQIRAVRVEKTDADTSTQAAGASGGEKVLNEDFPGGEG